VTHDQEEAMALADHVVVMNHGRIEDEGSPERVYARPATRFTATFMGESTIVAGEVDARSHHTALGAFDAPALQPAARPASPSGRSTSSWAGHPRNREEPWSTRGASSGSRRRRSMRSDILPCWRACLPGHRSRREPESRFAFDPAE
jgi:ABC-type glutathione transport system ATPase component